MADFKILFYNYPIMKMYYEILFMISILFMGIYAIIWRKRYSVYFTLIFILIPLAIRGYVLTESPMVLEQAITGLKLSYIGGPFLMLFMMLAIFDFCNLNSRKWLRLVLFILSILMYLPIATLEKNTLFYKDIHLEFVNNQPLIIKTYGPLHTVHYVFLIFYLAITTGAIIYSLKKKKDVSEKKLVVLLFCEAVTTILFFAGHIFHMKFELAPVSYLVSEFVFLTMISRISLYDITETAIDTIVINGNTGFISFDKHFRYLSSNTLAKEVFPSLSELRTDSNAAKNPILNFVLISKIRTFIEDNTKNYFYKNCDDKIYQVNIDYLYAGKKKCGYMLYIQDDTKDQKYISLLNDFNGKLKDEVDEKTRHIEKMHDNLILGMATMVESRDNSTGGHIKRTSDVIEILVGVIEKDTSDDKLNLSPEFCHNLIKAAPMHDLGKIAVDDAILRKPGRFTDEEFAVMKTHTTEGARIVHEILKETDDYDFHILAENVAHYHHERWDGSGYPEGLRGEQIPLEARIMAIADVYDALVSKRVYKESMSFENANKIIMEGMGKHFDKRLEKYYVEARPMLEEYYSKIN